MILKGFGRKLMNQSLKKRIANQSIWNLIASILTKFSAVFVLWIAARNLEADVFGKLTLIQSTLVAFQVFSSMGLGTTASKFAASSESMSNSRTVQASILSSWLFFSLPVLILMLVFSDRISIFLLFDEKYKLYIQCISFAIFFSSLKTVISGYIIGMEKPIILTKSGIISVIINLPLTYWLIVTYGLMGGVISVLVLEIITVLLICYFFFSVDNGNGKLKYNFTEIVKIVKFTLPISFSGMLIMPVNWYLLREISLKYSFVDVGLINILNQWQGILIFIPVSIATGIMPILTKESKKDKVFNLTLKMVLIITLTLGSFVTIVSPYIISTYNDLYKEFSIVFYCSIMMSCACIMVISNLFNNLIISISEPNVLLKGNIIWALVCIGMFYLLIDYINPITNIFISRGAAYLVKIIYTQLVYRSKKRAIINIG